MSRFATMFSVLCLILLLDFLRSSVAGETHDKKLRLEVTGHKGKQVHIDFSRLLPTLCDFKTGEFLPECIVQLTENVRNGDLFADTVGGTSLSLNGTSKTKDNVFVYQQDPHNDDSVPDTTPPPNGTFAPTSEDPPAGPGPGAEGEPMPEFDNDEGMYRLGSPFDSFEVKVFRRSDTATVVATAVVLINIVDALPTVLSAHFWLPPGVDQLRLPALKAIDADASIKNDKEIANTTVVSPHMQPCCGWQLRVACSDAHDTIDDIKNRNVFFSSVRAAADRSQCCSLPAGNEACRAENPESEGEKTPSTGDGSDVSTSSTSSFDFVAFDADGNRSTNVGSVAATKLTSDTPSIFNMRPAVFRTLVLCHPNVKGEASENEGQSCDFSVLATDFLSTTSTSSNVPAFTMDVDMTTIEGSANQITPALPENVPRDSHHYYTPASGEMRTALMQLHAEFKLAAPSAHNRGFTAQHHQPAQFEKRFSYTARVQKTTKNAETQTTNDVMVKSRVGSGAVVDIRKDLFVCTDVRMEPFKLLHVEDTKPSSSSSNTLMFLLKSYNISLSPRLQAHAPEFIHRTGTFSYIVTNIRAGVDSSSSSASGGADPIIVGIFYNLKLQRIVEVGDEVDEVDIAFITMSEYTAGFAEKYNWGRKSFDFLAFPPGSFYHKSLELQMVYRDTRGGTDQIDDDGDAQEEHHDDEVDIGLGGHVVCNAFNVLPPKGPVDDLEPPQPTLWTRASIDTKPLTTDWRVMSSSLSLNELLKRQSFCMESRNTKPLLQARYTTGAGFSTPEAYATPQNPSHQVFEVVQNGYKSYPVKKLSPTTPINVTVQSPEGDVQSPNAGLSQEALVDKYTVKSQSVAQGELALMIQDFETRGRLNFQLQCKQDDGTSLKAETALMVDLQKKKNLRPTIRRMGAFCNSPPLQRNINPSGSKSDFSRMKDARSERNHMPQITYGLPLGDVFRDTINISGSKTRSSRGSKKGKQQQAKNAADRLAQEMIAERGDNGTLVVWFSVYDEDGSSSSENPSLRLSQLPLFVTAKQYYPSLTKGTDVTDVSNPHVPKFVAGRTATDDHCFALHLSLDTAKQRSIIAEVGGTKNINIYDELRLTVEDANGALAVETALQMHINLHPSAVPNAAKTLKVGKGINHGSSFVRLFLVFSFVALAAIFIWKVRQHSQRRAGNFQPISRHGQRRRDVPAPETVAEDEDPRAAEGFDEEEMELHNQPHRGGDRDEEEARSGRSRAKLGDEDIVDY